MAYDPAKAHQYYEEHKHLKGRQKGVATPVGDHKPGKGSDAQQRSIRLAHKVQVLQNALQEVLKELSQRRSKDQKSRANAAKTAAKNSDGKTTAKEKQASKKYRQKNQAVLANKRKQANATGGSSSSGSSSGKNGLSKLSTSELTARATKIRGLIKDAQQQLRSANALSHSSIVHGEDSLVHNGIDRR